MEETLREPRQYQALYNNGHIRSGSVDLMQTETLLSPDRGGRTTVQQTSLCAQWTLW